MKRFDSFSFLFATSIVILAGCGTSTIGGGTGAGGSGGGDTGGGGGVAGGLPGGGLCNGQATPVSCAPGGCEPGYSCIVDADPTTCHPSNCACGTDGWACTADCGMGGSTCLPVPATCNGGSSPADCITAGCQPDFVCAPDPDPTVCHPSSCQCDTQGWVCTADCSTNGHICVKGL
jgi:hypothetical protein